MTSNKSSGFSAFISIAINCGSTTVSSSFDRKDGWTGAGAKTVRIDGLGETKGIRRIDGCIQIYRISRSGESKRSTWSTDVLKNFD